MHPHHLHATAAAWSLHLARRALVDAIEAERDQQRRDAVTTAAAASLQAWRPVIGRARGGHGDPVGDAALGTADAWVRPLGRGPLARLEVRVDQQLYWVTRGVSLDRVRQLLPRTSPVGAAILAGWCTGLATEIRTALGTKVVEELLPGTECPACRVRGLQSWPAGPASAVTLCPDGCLCSGVGCPCRMPVKAAGVAHVWAVSVVARAA